MSVRLTEREMIILEGLCPSEDAEKLLQRLLTTPHAKIDLRLCLGLHTALLQVLLAARPALILPVGESEPAKRLLAQLRAVVTG